MIKFIYHLYSLFLYNKINKNHTDSFGFFLIKFFSNFSSGISYYKEERKTSKVTGGKKPWELEVDKENAWPHACAE